MGKDITPYNKQGNAHGYWEKYHYNGQLAYKGSYVNGKKHGYWEMYWSDGQIWYKEYYFEGNEVSEQEFIELSGKLSNEPSYLFY